MNARLILNTGLLALLAALAWFTFKVDTPPPAPAGVALTSLSVEDITTIQIDRDGNTVARLQRNGDIWRVQTPLSASADAFRVHALLGLARARSTVGFRAIGNDLTQYGLQPPLARVRFDNTELFIGDTDPVAGQRYVMNDDQVHLLEDNWFSLIFGDGRAWLDPRPLPADISVQRIELSGDLNASGGKNTRWQQLDGRWQRTPAEPAASAQSIEQRGTALASTWRQARALAVQRRDRTISWSGQVLINFKLPPQSQPAARATADDATDLRPPAHSSAGVETIIFAVALTDDAMFLARDDLDVQYRFLRRQGNALLGVNTAP